MWLRLQSLIFTYVTFCVFVVIILKYQFRLNKFLSYQCTKNNDSYYAYLPFYVMLPNNAFDNWTSFLLHVYIGWDTHDL